MATRQKYPLTPEAHNEIDRFRKEIDLLEAGQKDADDFRRFRLNNGIYGIRFKTDEHMIRIKVPFGKITADQLDEVADVAAEFTPTRLSHVTTRQAIQLHNLKRGDAPEILRRVNESGLTSREACGNTVRNVTCDELAGLHPDELFDVTPYADLLVRYFLRNPVCQNLPRKFKIAFEGCPKSDRARLGIHDLGFRAAVREKDGRKEFGFSTVVGGGLGSVPFPAQVLEEFTPLTEYLATTEAAIRLFDRHGDRRDKNRARIKFVVAKWGIEEFRKQFMDEKRAVLATGSGRHELFDLTLKEEAAPAAPAGRVLEAPAALPGYERWRATNVLSQKQKGYAAVYIRCLYGDLTPEQAHEAASVARDFGGGRIRTTITQNLLLAWIPETALKTVYTRLSRIGLGQADAQSVADITRCPGADTCNLAITHSKGLARDLTAKVFSDDFADDPQLSAVTIKISGCINSCGQHHIANVGFFGASRNIDGKQVPHYQMMIGGRTGVTTAEIKFGERIAFIPARRISEAVRHLLGWYKKDRRPAEPFLAWTDRTGAETLKIAMSPFADMEALKADPKTMFEDLGDDSGESFKVAVGKGECAG